MVNPAGSGGGVQGASSHGRQQIMQIAVGDHHSVVVGVMLQWGAVVGYGVHGHYCCGHQMRCAWWLSHGDAGWTRVNAAALAVMISAQVVAYS